MVAAMVAPMAVTVVLGRVLALVLVAPAALALTSLVLTLSRALTVGRGGVRERRRESL